jgi:hypothetical protein
LDILKAKEIETKSPKIKKKTHLAFQTFDIKDARFVQALEREDYYIEKNKKLGQFGEMGSYDFEDEESCIGKHKEKMEQKLSGSKLRKGDSFYIHRDDLHDVNFNRKFSMFVPTKNKKTLIGKSIHYIKNKEYFKALF